MTKREQIKQAVQNILDTCPHYNNKVYLLEDYEFGMKSIDVMFETHYEENKCIKLDKNGAYIMGRGQNQGDKSKMYIHEFSGIELSEYTISKLDEYKKSLVSKLDTRIPSKDIHVGDVCNQFIKDKGVYSNPDYRCLYLYVGKCEVITEYIDSSIDNKINKYNVYVDMYDNNGLDEFKYEIKEGWNNKDIIEHKGWFRSEKSKIRFDKKLSKVDMDIIKLLREEYEREECKSGHKYEKRVIWKD